MSQDGLPPDPATLSEGVPETIEPRSGDRCMPFVGGIPHLSVQAGRLHHKVHDQIVVRASRLHISGTGVSCHDD